MMNIADPDGLNRLPTAATGDLTGKMSFPFLTVEDVMMVDDTHIMVANDNNLPCSSGRALDSAADNEFILLSVSEFLAARSRAQAHWPRKAVGRWIWAAGIDGDPVARSAPV